MNKRAIVFFILIILWMGFIFYMSSVGASKSDSNSKGIVSYIITKYDQIINASNETRAYHQSKEFLNTANHVFRKVCHFTEYFILGLLLINFFLALEYFTLLKCSILSLLIVLLYAISDEFHQVFIDGRSGQISDVLLDTFGGIVSILIITYIIYLRKKVKSA